MTPFGTPLDRHLVPELPDAPDHAAAFAEVLRRYANLIEHGKSAEDAARDLLPIVRIAARYV